MSVTAEERRLIDDLFGKLQHVERDAAPRDPEAEALIGHHMSAQPNAAYYLAQTVVAQERALEQAQARIDALERGGADANGRSLAPRAGRAPGAGPWGSREGGRGGGFLAGAAQTAVGVAGGVVVGSMLMNAFGGDEAQAATPEPDAAADAGDAGGGDEGGFDGGDFDGGDVGGDF